MMNDSNNVTSSIIINASQVINSDKNEIKCADQNHTEELFANRFCKLCQIPICPNCAVDNHIDHIKESQIKLDDYIQLAKDQLMNLKIKLENKINNSTFTKKLTMAGKSYFTGINQSFDETENQLNNLKGKIDSAIEKNSDLKKKLNSLTNDLLRGMNDNQIYKKVLQKTNDLDHFLQKWTHIEKSERLKYLSNSHLIEAELSNDLETLEKENYSNKNLNNHQMDNELNLTEILKKNNNYNKLFLSKLNESISEMMKNQNKIEDQIEKEKDFVSDKVGKEYNLAESNEDLNKMPIDNPNNEDINRRSRESENKNKSLSSSYQNEEKNGKFRLERDLSNPRDDLNSKNKSNLNENSEINNVNNNKLRKSERLTDLKYLLSLRVNSSNRSETQLIYTDLTKEELIPFKIKIEEYQFLNKKPSNIIFPPEQSKQVNIGNQLVICGGHESGRQLDNCYILTFNIIEENQPKIEIKNYPKLNKKRERHNMIYLNNINSILICGGFYSKTAEISEIEKDWKILPEMKHERTNATMMYFNSRYVYCIGGYEMTDKSNPCSGVYISSFECLDLNEVGKGWALFNYDNLSKLSMKLCAMGVISISPNIFYLVGGFDGCKYMSDVNEVCVEEINNIPRVTAISHLPKFIGLGKGVLFFHTNFAYSNERFVNYDMQSKLYIYHCEKKSFQIVNLN